MNNEVIIFENQNIKLEVNMKDETVWLSANQMAKLFDRDVKTIRKHISNALKEELRNEMVVANFESTTKHGAINRYNKIIDACSYKNTDIKVVISIIK